MKVLVDVDEFLTVNIEEIASLQRVVVENPNYIPSVKTKTTYFAGRGEPFLEDKCKIVLKNGYECTTNKNINEVKQLLNERLQLPPK